MRHKIVNFASLTTIQVSNAVLPLVIFPYTLAMVGPELYSKIVLSEALCLFLLTVVLFSFEVDGVAQVVGLGLRRNAEELSHLFSSVLYLRLLLFAIGAPLVILSAWLLDRELLPLVLGWALVPLSYAIQPNWFFQGMEHNAPVAALILVSRVVAVGLILATVHTPADYILVPFAIGILYLAGAVGGVLYAMHRFGIRFVKVQSAHLKQMLWSGKEIFFGNLSVIAYRDANVLILGFLGASDAGIASYSMAEKFVKAIQAAARPLNQIYFPKALRLAQAASAPTKKIFWDLLRLTLPQIGVLATGVLFLVAVSVGIGERVPQLRRIENADQIIFLVILMSGATFFGVSNFMFGSAGLNALGERRYLLQALIGTGLLNLILTSMLVVLTGVLGAAIGFILAEALLFIAITRKYFQ